MGSQRIIHYANPPRLCLDSYLTHFYFLPSEPTIDPPLLWHGLSMFHSLHSIKVHLSITLWLLLLVQWLACWAGNSETRPGSITLGRLIMIDGCGERERSPKLNSTGCLANPVHFSPLFCTFLSDTWCRTHRSPHCVSTVCSVCNPSDSSLIGITSKIKY